MSGHWTDLLEPGGGVGRFLDWDAVRDSAGLSRTTAWRLAKRGDFPSPYPLSAGRVAYSEREIEAWKRWRAAQRSGGAVPSCAHGRSRRVRAPEPVPPRVPAPPPSTSLPTASLPLVPTPAAPIGAAPRGPPAAPGSPEGPGGLQRLAPRPAADLHPPSRPGLRPRPRPRRRVDVAEGQTSFDF